MRILILVLSYTEPPYDALLKAQQETWDSEKRLDVNTYFYTGNRVFENTIFGHQSSFYHRNPCSDEYYMMHWKFKLALDVINGAKYDFIFRTNSSSYVNKEKLLQYAETLPKERCFAGWSLGEKEAVSGAGIFLSPDMAEILRNELPEGENIEEDILIGRILHGKHGVEITDDKSRFDVREVNIDTPSDKYHYRFKTPDRMQDVKNMYALHKMLTR